MHGLRAEGCQNLFVDPVNAVVARDVHQDSPLPVETEHWHGLSVIDFDPFPDRFWPVVVPLVEFPAALAASFGGGVLAFAIRYAPESDPGWLTERRGDLDIEYFDHNWGLNAWRR